MAARRLIVIGASAGGIEAVRDVAAALPADLPAAVCVVIHTSGDSPGILPLLFDRVSALEVHNATDGQRLEEGHLYLPAPDRHLLVTPGAIRLSRAPRENRFRPAVDPLFRSAAQIYGPACIGVVLTGSLDDGTAGLWAIKRLGGVAVVQDPADALFPSMPESAIRHVDVDHVVPLDGVAPLLVRLAAVHPSVSAAGIKPAPEPILTEVRIANEEPAMDAGIQHVAEPSLFSCPECHGVLLRLKDADPARFRCHTGHAFTTAGLLAALGENAETALWNAVRVLEESAVLLEHLQNHADQGPVARQLAERARRTRARTEALRRLAFEGSAVTSSER